MSSPSPAWASRSHAIREKYPSPERTISHGPSGLKSAPELILPLRLAAGVAAQFALSMCKYWAWINRCDPFGAKNGGN
jgi:hypothetical protein